MADDSPRSRRSAKGDAEPPEQDQLFGDLSGMAREAVRSPADPRLDAHLAFLGLAQEPVPTNAETADEPAPAAPTSEPSIPLAMGELEQLRATLARLERTVAEAEVRVRQLTFVIGLFGIASALALIISLVR